MLTWASHNDHTQNKSTFAYYITSTYYYNHYQRCSNQTRWDTQICPQIVNHSIAYVQSISQHHQFHHLAILYTMHKVPHTGAYNTGMYKLTKQCRHLAMYQRGWALCTPSHNSWQMNSTASQCTTGCYTQCQSTLKNSHDETPHKNTVMNQFVTHVPPHHIPL